MGHAAAANCSPNGRWIDLALANVNGACRRHRPGKAPAIAVKHGKRPQIGAVQSQSRMKRHRQRLQVRSAMRVHYALRAARASAGVINRQQRHFVHQVR